MSRTFPTLFLLAAALLAAPGPAEKKTAFDKPTMEAYVRHLFVLGPQITVQISDPKPSQLPGFMEVRMKATAGNGSQEMALYVSKDGRRIVQGNVFDVTQNPFKPELDKLKTQNTPSFGAAGAPVVLVEFSDFECNYCKQEAKVLRDNLKSAYPTQARLYFKDFPLDPIHPWARGAAIAGRCVYKQNAELFWNYHDWMFEHQGDITADNLKAKVLEWANGKELDPLQFSRCTDNKETEAEINTSVTEGKALDVNSTPTLFINGRRMPGTTDWPTLRAIIDYEIEYQKTAKNAGEDCGCEIKLPSPVLGK